MTEEQFYTSVTYSIPEDTLLMLDNILASLETVRSEQYFGISDQSGRYGVGVNVLVNMRAFAKNLIELTEDWEISPQDTQNGFSRFEDRVESLRHVHSV